ncbi:cellulase family glycosylhydrolase [Elioraea sp.]|uniref:cellulase family glycosylhydrolase n=1 Tax=Elioraea sp. TaxID=2185103 RepID=UPI0025BA0004|nr:cellulase family glycosylhydrolase [Elioraea sp.]
MIRPEDDARSGAVPETLAASLGQGINIQGWSLWGEKVFSPAEMQRLKADGFDHVRLYFDARLTDGDPAYPTAMDKDWVIAKADQTIANAMAAGLTVVINPTPGIAPEDSPAAIDAHVAFLGAYTARLAGRFDMSRLVIETTNEPSFPSQTSWEAVESRLIAAVRAASPDVTIMTAANLRADEAWYQLGGLSDTAPYRDDNLIYSVHTYFPQVFTGQTNGVAHWPATPTLAATTGGTLGWFYREGYGSEAALATRIDEFARTADALGVPLHIGEFGVLASAPAASRLAYLAAATEQFERHDLGWTVWQSHGLHGIYTRTDAGLQPAPAATLAALGLGTRPDQKLTVTFSAGSLHDLWAKWNGTAFLPAEGASTTLSAAKLGGAAAGSTASVSMVRDAAGALTVKSLGPWKSVAHLGVEDDEPGTVTASGFERSWISLGNGGSSIVSVETLHHRIMTGNGADHVTITTVSPGTVTLGGTGYVSTGAGDDLIEITAKRLAGNTGAVTATTEVWAGAGDDRIVITGGTGGMFSGGSGDDVIVSGAGNEDLRGDVGIDTLVLPGLRSAWRFSLKSDATGQFLEAVGPGGTDRLRGFEWVEFADGTTARFGELWGDKAPSVPLLVTTGLAEGVVAKARATDPEGKPLTWFLSDTAGKRFEIDPYSGEISVRPGGSVTAGERYAIGVGVVDAAGNVAGATLSVTAPATVLPAGTGLAAKTAAILTLSNGVAGDGVTQLRSTAWNGDIVQGTSRTLTGSELALPGVAADARVMLGADAAGAVTVSVLSAWNSVKNVFLRDLDGGTLTVHNAVSVDIAAAGQRPVTLAITGAKRGDIATGAGDDVITVAAVANTPDAAAFTIDAGGGNDRITLTSSSAWTRGVIDAGSGDDLITGGPGDDTIRGGAGIDTVRLAGARADTRFSGVMLGDGLAIIAEGPGGRDVLRGIEYVEFAAGGRHRLGELIGNAAPTAITLAALREHGATAPGVLAVARATDADDIAGLTWAIRGAAASLFAIDGATGEITALPGTTPGTRYTLELAVTDPWGNVLVAPVALTTPGIGALVTISNATTASLKPLYDNAWVGGVAGTVLLGAAELVPTGAPSTARVSITEADGTVDVRVSSAWNSVKNVLVEDADGGMVHIGNVVHAGFVGTGTAASTLAVTDAKRADLVTGGGDDTILVKAFSNIGGDGNRIAVDAGAGDDTVTVTGHGSWTTALLKGGAGDDVLGFTGGGAAVLDGGAGADVMRGGAGRDQFVLRPGEVAGDRIDGFAGAAASGGDWLVMQGFGAGAALTHQAGGLWRVSYVSAGVTVSESFTITGVTTLAIADDVIWM